MKIFGIAESTLTNNTSLGLEIYVIDTLLLGFAMPLLTVCGKVRITTTIFSIFLGLNFGNGN